MDVKTFIMNELPQNQKEKAKSFLSSVDVCFESLGIYDQEKKLVKVCKEWNPSKGRQNTLTKD